MQQDIGLGATDMKFETIFEINPVCFGTAVMSRLLRLCIME